MGNYDEATLDPEIQHSFKNLKDSETKLGGKLEITKIVTPTATTTSTGAAIGGTAAPAPTPTTAPAPQAAFI